jgi:glyoxylase-like metal-dependent hydrolase (beta-lactamase superfamily II)
MIEGFMYEIHVIDLNYGVPRTTAAFVVVTEEGPVLVETGPESTHGVLTGWLRALGYAPEEVRHVLLTHVHLDHAGAAWRFAERGATVYVHPRGLRHLRDPSRLLASARRIFGERTEELWRHSEPVSGARLRAVEDGEVLRLGGVSFEALETPGHADHHHAWRVEGTIFTGDVGGVRIGGGPVFPPTPPPEIRVEVWQKSIFRLRSLNAEEIYLSHFGRFTDVADHLEKLETRLLEWADWVYVRLRKRQAPGSIGSEFHHYVSTGLDRVGLGPHEKQEYEFADPAWMNVGGLIRYWQKHHPESLV